jgi:hypothetical protein
VTCDNDYLVTVAVVFEATDAAAARLEPAIADALMSVPEVATVRIEYAPEPSVCRVDASGAAPEEASARVLAAIRRVARQLGATCQIRSVGATTSRCSAESSGR